MSRLSNGTANLILNKIQEGQEQFIGYRVEVTGLREAQINAQELFRVDVSAINFNSIESYSKKFIGDSL